MWYNSVMIKYKLHAAIVSYIGEEKIILVSTKINENKDLQSELKSKESKLVKMLNKYLKKEYIKYTKVDKTIIEPVYVYDVEKITIPSEDTTSYAKGAKIYGLISKQALFVYNNPNTTAPTNMQETFDVTTETIVMESGEGALVRHWQNKYNKNANILKKIRINYPDTNVSHDITTKDYFS